MGRILLSEETIYRPQSQPREHLALEYRRLSIKILRDFLKSN